MKFKPLCLVLCAIHLAFAADAQPLETWLAVAGNPNDPTVDTVEVNLGSLKPRGKTKLIDVRVSLAKQRNMVDGEKYASYASLLEIDCAAGAVFHVRQTRFVEKAWQGAQTTENFAGDKPMAFGGLIPSPKPAVLRAACQPR